jgi:predicted amidophosphoribosyltransferase
MTIPLSSFCYYLTEVDGIQWRDDDHKARMIIKGIKREPFNGTLYTKKRSYTSANIGDFLDILFPHLGQHLAKLGYGKISIVPIPNSNMAVGARGPFRGVDHATLLAKGYAPQADVCPALRWKTPRQPAHKTKGFRSPDLYQPHLKLVEKPKNPIVLYDDVLNSSSQMKASARFLKEQGYTPIAAVVVGLATKVQESPVFKWKTEDFEFEAEPFDWDF